MPKKLIIGNWKMLPPTLAEAQDILAKLDDHLRGIDGVQRPDVAICPPYVFIEEVAHMLGEGVLAGSVTLGAQDIAAREEAGQTGEISGAQLTKLGVRYVIIGHSERRWKMGEDDAVVNAKLGAALRAGLVPVVCLGERTREGDWQGALALQTSTTFAGMSADLIARCLIAYEPVWAISTNPGAKPDTAASAVASMGLIRDVLADQFRVSRSLFLYGGSVTPANALEFLERPEIGGLLVGGASVRPDDFAQVLTIASQL